MPSSTLTPETRPSTRRVPARDLALIATFAALIGVLSMLKVEIGLAVPISLGTLGVMLAGSILGARRGVLAVATYLVLVLVGLPWTAKGVGGPAVFTGPTGGYLVGYPFGALVIGLLVASPRLRGNVIWVFLANLIGGVAVIYLFGIVGMRINTGVEWAKAAAVSSFLPGDLIKAGVAAAVAAAVHRAFPELLARR